MSYSSKIEQEIKGRELWVNLRGGKPIKIPISVNTIIPDVHVINPNFDFGGITYGNSGVLTMVITNNSSISAMLNLDLRERDSDPESEGYSCIGIHYQGTDAESVVLEEKEPDELMLMEQTNMEIEPEKILGDNDSELEDNSIMMFDKNEATRFFKIKVKPGKKYEFELRFTPIKPKVYSFYLPLTLAGYGKIEGLTRRVVCKGITPKFLMEPLNGVIEFRKKTITSQDSILPEYQYISLSNPDSRNALNWKLDIDSLDRDKVFTIIPTEGTIDPQSTITLKTGFKPANQNVYEVKLPLRLENEDKPYCKITLKGEGAYPRILFDRRDVILPIVPLGVESRCSFRIINDGYQSLNLKYSIPQNLGNIPIQ